MPLMLAIIRKRRNLNFSRPSRSRSGFARQAQWAEWIDPMGPAATYGALGRFGRPGDRRRNDRFGTLIRHARPTVPLPVAALSNKVGVPARCRLLIAPVGGMSLLAPSFCSALGAAIALTTVATAANKEPFATAWTPTIPRSQRRFGRLWLDFGLHLITIPRIADDWTDDRAFGG